MKRLPNVGASPSSRFFVFPLDRPSGRPTQETTREPLTRWRSGSYTKGVKAIDLFAGIGGWSLPLRELGIRTLGVEFNKHAAATRDAAGLSTLCMDVRELNPLDFEFDVLVGSPPCQAFSQASKVKRGLKDSRGLLVFEPDRWVRARRPCFVALEQVRGAKKHFEAMASGWSELGYKCETRTLNAAEYGTPQRRKRAILLARLDEAPVWPKPRPEATAASALPHRSDLPPWAHERPATTVVGTFRPEIISPPGYRGPGEYSRHNAPGGFSTSLEERLVLQGFPSDWPLQGPKTAKSLQVGNAVPPPLTRAILRANLGPRV